MNWDEENVANNNVALVHLRNLRQLEKEIYDLEIFRGKAESTVRSLQKSKEELEKQLSEKSHSDREREQEKLLLVEINKSLKKSTEELTQSKNELEKKLIAQSRALKELVQEKTIVTEVSKVLKDSASKLERSKEELEKQLSEKSHSDKEIEQERLLRLEINRILLGKIEELQKSKEYLEEKIDIKSKSHKELAQERLILSEIATSERIKSKKAYKKYYVSIAIIAIIASGAFTGYSYYQNEVVLKTTSELLSNLKSKYVIQNLRGDTVDTWVSWRIVEDRILSVSIVNTAKLDEKKIDVVKDVILSAESVELDDSLLNKGPQGTSSTYYKGWKGALSSISQPTEFVIPSKLEVIQGSKLNADIAIELTKLKDADGLSGYTKSIADGNQILKSQITIYQADTLSDTQLSAIVRHEFGHAIGLAHSTAPEDLMAPVIKTSYPYISDCDIDAITTLYDGKKGSEVICEK